jgi:hypothetical protein
LRKDRALAVAVQRLEVGAKTPRVSVHDELAIRNDLDAIHASAALATAGIAKGLSGVAALHREGVLTPEECAGLKRQISGRSSGVEDVIRLLRGLKTLERGGVLTEAAFNINNWDIPSKRLLRKDRAADCRAILPLGPHPIPSPAVCPAIQGAKSNREAIRIGAHGVAPDSPGHARPASARDRVRCRWDVHGLVPFSTSPCPPSESIATRSHAEMNAPARGASTRIAPRYTLHGH